MIVRSSHGGTSKSNRSSNGTSSRKRRRQSANQSSIKFRRSVPESSRNRSSGASARCRPGEGYIDSDSAESDRFENDLYEDWGERHHRRGIADDVGHDYHHWSDGYGSDTMGHGANNDPDSFLHREPQKRGGDLQYPIHRYDTTIPRYRPRTLSRPKVIRRTQRPKLTRATPSHHRPKSGQTTLQKPEALRQRTLYSHITNWFPQIPSTSRPQFVNRPYFQPAPRRAEPQTIPNRGQPSGPSVIPHSLQEGKRNANNEAVPNNYLEADQGWENESDFAPAPPAGQMLPPPLPSQKVQKVLPNAIPSGHQNRLADAPGFQESVMGNNLILNGLYFSRDTYIGRGMLSQVLRAMSTQLSEVPSAPDYTFQINFFGRPFTPDWDDMSTVEQALKDVILDLQSQLQSIQESQRQQGHSYYHSGSHSTSELVACLLALESMTTLLIDRMAVSDRLGSASFWMTFRSTVIGALTKLIESTPEEQQQHSVMSGFVLWTKWAMVTWEVLSNCILEQEHDSIDGAVMTLLRLLLENDNKSFLRELAKSLNPHQLLQGVIHGQDHLEIWVCLIQTLNRYAQLRGSHGFWFYFNRQVQQTWTMSSDTLEAGVGSRHGMTWQDQESHVLALLQGMCMLHQFGREGSSNATIRTGENWELISWLLQKNWLERTLPESTATERQLRRLLVYCHTRIQKWGWIPVADVVTHMYRYFANRKFKDMPSESGYRMPEFLKRMIRISTSDPAHPKTNTTGVPGVTSELQPSMAYTEMVDGYDSCFEIFLKITAKILLWQVCEIGTDGQHVEAVARPAGTSFVDPQGPVDEPFGSQAAAFRALHRTEKIRACRRLLASISLTSVVTISAAGSSEQTYSSLCNPCNLVLTVSLLVPETIRPSTVSQLKNLFNFDESDNASRRIILEAMFYLGIVWQRQADHDGASQNGRSPAKIIDYLFGRLEFLCQEFEKDQEAMNAGLSYISRSKRKAPLSNLIEKTLGYIARLLTLSGSVPSRIPYPSLVFLDQSKIQFALDRSRALTSCRAMGGSRSNRKICLGFVCRALSLLQPGRCLSSRAAVTGRWNCRALSDATEGSCRATT